MRIAYFSPLPPQRTGIADYSATLLPHLAAHADVTLFVDDPGAVTPLHLPVRAIAAFTDAYRERMDICIYQMGNNVRFHRQIYATALRQPGLLVLHDINLYAFHDDLFVGGGRPGGLLRELGFADGMRGVAAGLEILRDPAQRDDAHFPLMERLAARSLGVLVHSEYARRTVARRSPRTPVRHVNQPVPLRTDAWRDGRKATAAAKTRLGYAPETLLVASFGYAAWTKRIDRVLPVLAALRPHFPQMRYAVVGKVIEGYDVEAQAAALGISDMVRFTGFVDEATYAAYLDAADIGVNLRYPSTGETSAALLGLLATGTPTLVSDADAFAELPAEAVVKIAPDATEADRLRAELALLLDDADRRTQMGRAAAAYIAQACDPDAVARRYVDFAGALLADLLAPPVFPVRQS
ncbi:MAG: glycosyltransferase family 4 protein [Caldilineaceae bacterium]|nr:glycosyltransferase family 4 protein [Caldilineaceae bacterium]